MEHDDIVIYFNHSVSKSDINKLKKLSKFTYKGSGVEVVYNAQIKEPIVVIAWKKMMKLQTFDEKKIKLNNLCMIIFIRDRRSFLLNTKLNRYQFLF